MAAYYNDSDPFCAGLLRALIAGGRLPAGDVDDRSIEDVRSDDLRGFVQCHFFAGIGGWPLALRLADWPDDRPVWTGSCPCQPFSTEGKRRGFADERHLWPAWFGLVRERRPATIFGEQVASATAWLDEVLGDLEGVGYACGLAILPAIGAPHRRERLYLVAHADGAGLAGPQRSRRGVDLQPAGQDVPGHAWAADPEVLRAADGLPDRLVRPRHYRERIRSLGNAVVPHVAAQFVAAAEEALRTRPAMVTDLFDGAPWGDDTERGGRPTRRR